jgi:hypothetical protein
MTDLHHQAAQQLFSHVVDPSVAQAIVDLRMIVRSESSFIRICTFWDVERHCSRVNIRLPSDVTNCIENRCHFSFVLVESFA